MKLSTPPTLSHLLKSSKLADVKQNKAQAIIDQVVSVAERFLTVINNYNIEKELSNQVIHDMKANIDRMAI
ncbi:MAG TPA: hypothetical protein DC010_01025 [Psychrobacter sp.]|nr:hypothetical protein [Psychrobacter sp.]